MQKMCVLLVLTNFMCCDSCHYTVLRCYSSSRDIAYFLYDVRAVDSIVLPSIMHYVYHHNITLTPVQIWDTDYGDNSINTTVANLTLLWPDVSPLAITK